MKFLLVLRSLLFYVGYLTLIGIFSLISCSLGLFLPLRKRQDVATCGNLLIDHWLRLTCNIKVRIIGRENIPPESVVILSNHQSPWETFYLQRHLRPVSTILKKELLRIPFFGWGLASVGPIAIDRSNPRKALREVLEQGKARLRAGINVIVYPEGTRIPYGIHGEYARSGAALAIAAEVKILPVAHNAGRCWPARKFLKFPGTITLCIGPALDSAGSDSKELTTRAETWIKSCQQQLESESISLAG